MVCSPVGVLRVATPESRYHVDIECLTVAIIAEGVEFKLAGSYRDNC